MNNANRAKHRQQANEIHSMLTLRKMNRFEIEAKTGLTRKACLHRLHMLMADGKVTTEQRNATVYWIACDGEPVQERQPVKPQEMPEIMRRWGGWTV
jgi:predicted transcriptional regulator